MTLDEIFEQWDKDSKIDPIDLGSALLDIPLLHNKYHRILAGENRELRRLKSAYKKLVSLKTDYYMGVLNGTDQLRDLGWEPWLRKVLKADVGSFVDADQHVVKMAELLSEQEEKVSMVTAMIKDIMNRNYYLKSAVDWRKFTEGA